MSSGFAVGPLTIVTASARLSHGFSSNWCKMFNLSVRIFDMRMRMLRCYLPLCNELFVSSAMLHKGES